MQIEAAAMVLSGVRWNQGAGVLASSLTDSTENASLTSFSPWESHYISLPVAEVTRLWSQGSGSLLPGCGDMPPGSCPGKVLTLTPHQRVHPII